MKIKEVLTKFLKNKIAFFLTIIVILISIMCLIFYYKNTNVYTAYIIAKLEKSSELTTAKLNYTGMSEYKDSGLIFINRSDFIMVYEANARAGIDVKEIDVQADKITHTIWITIPKAKILEVKVNMDSIRYFDEKFALLNVDYKEDANRATSLAEKEAIAELEGMGILEMADEQAETLIKGLIQDVIPKNYEIKVKQ